MGKSRRGSKEYTREQRLIHENQQLKREILKLRKKLDHTNLEAEGSEMDSETIPEPIKTKVCAKCHSDSLEYIVYSKLSTKWCFYKCTECGQRTGSEKV